MAAAKTKATLNSWTPSSKRKRPGVHAKSKRSVNKSGKNWTKPYRGQGR